MLGFRGQRRARNAEKGGHGDYQREGCLEASCTLSTLSTLTEDPDCERGTSSANLLQHQASASIFNMRGRYGSTEVHHLLGINKVFGIPPPGLAAVGR